MAARQLRAKRTSLSRCSFAPKSSAIVNCIYFLPQGRVVLPVGTSSISQQTLICWNMLVGQVMVTADVYDIALVYVRFSSQAMDATQWLGSGEGNSPPMKTNKVDSRALFDKRQLGHEYV
jgi:hypothetical protein